MTTQVIPSMDSSEGDVECVSIEHCAYETVYVSVMKDGREIGVYVERADLLKALRP